MWFVLISTFGIVILNRSLCFGKLDPPQYWPTALIHHPELTLDYAVRIETHPDERKRLEKFANLTKAERKETCRNYLVDAISFSIPPNKTDYIEDDFQSLVEETFAALVDPYIENLRYETVQGEREAPAHVCIEEDGYGQSWAISAGHDDGVSIVYQKAVGASKYHLFGLLEEMPNIDPRLSQRQLDILYVTGETELPNPNPTNSAVNLDRIDSASNLDSADSAPKINTVDDSFGRDLLRNLAERRSTRSLCSLNEFERFRVCAVGYLAWKHSKTECPNYNEGNYVSQNGQTKCIQGKIAVDFGTQNDSFSSLPTGSQRIEDKPFFVEADIIPCSINTKSHYVKFFLTSDPFTADSLFSVEALWKRGTCPCPCECHLGSNEIIAFELEHHMSNVRVLRP